MVGFRLSWLKKKRFCFKNVTRKIRGGSRIFSRGGERIFKKFSKILTTFFFRSTKQIFRALPKHCFAPILAKFCAPQANFWKNSQKSRFWAFFEKFWQKNRVFLARSPSKLVYIGAKGAFRKSLGSVGQKLIFKKVSKVGPPLNPPLRKMEFLIRRKH